MTPLEANKLKRLVNLRIASAVDLRLMGSQHRADWPLIEHREKQDRLALSAFIVHLTSPEIG